MTGAGAELEVLASSTLASPHLEGGVLLSARPDRWVVAFPQRGVVVKAYARRGGFRGILDRLFGDRARRMWAAARVARERGLPVPQVFALVRGPLGGAVVLELVAGGRPFREARRAAPSVEARFRLDHALASLLRTLHDARLYHGDFHQGNVLVDAAGAPVLVDLDGLRRVAFVSRRRRVRNLERLLRDFLGEHRVSRAARLRFLQSYASTRVEARALWRAVEVRSSLKRREYRLPEP